MSSSDDFAGAQVCVASSECLLASVAYGNARPAVAMATTTALVWNCATKPLVAVTVAALCDQLGLSLDAEVCDIVENDLMRTEVPRGVTIEHLLLHRVVFDCDPPMSLLASDGTWPSTRAVLRDVAISQLLPLNYPTSRFSRWAGWTVLAAVIEALSGCEPQAVIERETFEPLGMTSSQMTWSPCPSEAAGSYAGDGAWLHAGGPDPAHMSADVALGGSGPARDLIRIYEWLLRAKRSRGVVPPIVSFATLRDLCRSYNPGPSPASGPTRWAKAFCAEPKLFGSMCSVTTVGQWSETSVGFADLGNDVAVAIAIAKPVGRLVEDLMVMRQIVDAIYMLIGITSVHATPVRLQSGLIDLLGEALDPFASTR